MTEKNRQIYLKRKSAESRLTMNAVNGTIIDRRPGYEKEEFFMRRYVIFA